MASGSLTVNFILGLGGQLLLKLLMSYIWTTINMLQIVSHFQNLDVMFPA